jgi:hypothetical protein
MTMARQRSWRSEMKRQAIHDRSVIDHLVGTFHTKRRPASESRQTTPASNSLYYQIRKEWTPRNGGLAEF